MKAGAYQVAQDIMVGFVVGAGRICGVLVWAFEAIVRGVHRVAGPLVRWSLRREIARDDELLLLAMRHGGLWQAEDMLRDSIRDRRRALAESRRL